MSSDLPVRGPCRGRYRRWMDRAFVGALPPERSRALGEHVSGCADCRAYFDRLGYVRRALGPDRILPDDARDQIAAALRPSAPRAGPWLVAVPVVLAAAALALWVLPRHGGDSVFTARGRGVAERPPGVTLFCVSDRAGTGHLPAQPGEAVSDKVVTTSGPLPVGTLGCTIDGSLQVVYSTPSQGQLHMVVYGRTPDGTIHSVCASPPRGPGGAAQARRGR